MKHLISIVLLLITSTLSAQVHPYYQTALNLQGGSLKAALNDLIQDHTEFDYTDSNTDVWDMLKATDRDSTNPNNVILFYSGRSVDAAQEYNAGSGWSREHVWAKSRGDFGNRNGEGTDAHHIRPADISINSTRNNRNFDNCTVCSEVIDEGVATGNYTDDEEWVFEPRDEVKGDVARMLFYMDVRYEAEDGELDLELREAYLDKSDKAPFHARLSTLIAWHYEDPVSNEERYRNEVIYSQFQGNRNPFIDQPELVEYLYASKINEPWTEDTATATHERQLPEWVMFPNPADKTVQFGSTIETVQLYNLEGKLIQHLKSVYTLDVSNLPEGAYIIRLQNASTTSTKTLVIRR